MSRKRPKSLDAPVVAQMRRLESWAYLRCDQWKKKYRYTLINDFRQHITTAKNNTICAFELPNRYKDEKLYFYSQSQVELALTESCMDIMITDGFDIMSEKEWSQAAQQIVTKTTGRVYCKNKKAEVLPLPEGKPRLDSDDDLPFDNNENEPPF